MALGYAWLPAAEGAPKAILKEGLAALAAAMIVGSWWSLVLVPAALVAAALVWQRIGCSICASLWQRQPDLRATTLIWVAAIVGIAIGTIAAKQGPGALSWLRNRLPQ